MGSPVCDQPIILWHIQIGSCTRTCIARPLLFLVLCCLSGQPGLWWNYNLMARSNWMLFISPCQWEALWVEGCDDCWDESHREKDQKWTHRAGCCWMKSKLIIVWDWSEIVHLCTLWTHRAGSHIIKAASKFELQKRRFSTEKLQSGIFEAHIGSALQWGILLDVSIYRRHIGRALRHITVSRYASAWSGDCCAIFLCQYPMSNHLVGQSTINY